MILRYNKFVSHINMVATIKSQYRVIETKNVEVIRLKEKLQSIMASVGDLVKL